MTTEIHYICNRLLISHRRRGGNRFKKKKVGVPDTQPRYYSQPTGSFKKQLLIEPQRSY